MHCNSGVLDSYFSSVSVRSLPDSHRLYPLKPQLTAPPSTQRALLPSREVNINPRLPTKQLKRLGNKIKTLFIPRGPRFKPDKLQANETTTCWPPPPTAAATGTHAKLPSDMAPVS